MPRKQVPALPTYLRSAAERDLQHGPDRGVVQVLNEMVTHPDYPCLGARSVFRRDGVQIVVLEEMGEAAELGELADHLRLFAASTDPRGRSRR